MKRFYRNNGLFLAMFGLFLIFQIGLSLVGQRQYNQEQAEHGRSPIDYGQYVMSSSFWEERVLRDRHDGCAFDRAPPARLA